MTKYKWLLAPVLTIIIALFAFAVTWGTVKAETFIIKDNQAALKTTVSEIDKTNAMDHEVLKAKIYKHDESFAEQRTLLKAIDDKLGEMKTDIKEIRRGR